MSNCCLSCGTRKCASLAASLSNYCVTCKLEAKQINAEWEERINSAAKRKGELLNFGGWDELKYASLRNKTVILADGPRSSLGSRASAMYKKVSARYSSQSEVKKALVCRYATFGSICMVTGVPEGIFPRALHWDHNHQTLKLRGLVTPCINYLIGECERYPEIRDYTDNAMYRAIFDYLDFWQARESEPDY